MATHSSILAWRIPGTEEPKVPQSIGSRRVGHDWLRQTCSYIRDAQRVDSSIVCLWHIESPLDSKEIQPVRPKGNQSWTFIGRTDAETETPILWPPDAKSWLIWKDPDAGKDWRWEEKGMTEDEMVGWHHRLNGKLWEVVGWTGRPGVLQSMRSQRVRDDWATELNCHIKVIEACLKWKKKCLDVLPLARFHWGQVFSS